MRAVVGQRETHTALEEALQRLADKRAIIGSLISTLVSVEKDLDGACEKASELIKSAKFASERESPPMRRAAVDERYHARP